MEQIDRDKKRMDVKFYPIKNRPIEKLTHRIYRILIAVLVLTIIIGMIVFADFSGYVLKDVKDFFTTTEKDIETVKSTLTSRLTDLTSMYAGHSISLASPGQMYNRQSHHDTFGNINTQRQNELQDGWYGIDVSHWQHKIDWTQVIQDTIPQKLSFSIAKATQGTDYVDPKFAFNWKNITDKFEIAGSYHFYIFQDDPEKQAQNFINTVDLERGDLPPIVDLEFNCSKCDTLGITQSQMLRDLEKYISSIERHYGIKPILYTNEDFYNRYLSGNFEDFTFWMAKYSKTPPTGLGLSQSKSHDSAGAPSIAIWQFTNYDRLKGIPGRVDMNFLPAQSRDALKLVK